MSKSPFCQSIRESGSIQCILKNQMLKSPPTAAIAILFIYFCLCSFHWIQFPLIIIIWFSVTNCFEQPIKDRTKLSKCVKGMKPEGLRYPKLQTSGHQSKHKVIKSKIKGHLCRASTKMTKEVYLSQTYTFQPEKHTMTAK